MRGAITPLMGMTAIVPPPAIGTVRASRACAAARIPASSGSSPASRCARTSTITASQSRVMAHGCSIAHASRWS